MPPLPRPSAPSKLGRPTRAEAETRQAELLDAAADLFLELGYDAATLEQIAAAVGMTKRTIYSRHADKAALFLATVQRALERMTETQARTLSALADRDLETALVAIARMRIAQVTGPVGVKLQRLINAEARRFPEIFVAASEQVTQPVVDVLAAKLERHAACGEIVTRNAHLAATAFLSMVAGPTARLAVSGRKVDEIGIEAKIAFCVDLFLKGLQPRPK